MILYFTGTGNSRHAAEKIAEVCQDTAENIADHLKVGTYGAYTSKKPYVFIGPVYAGRYPKVMMDFLYHSVFNGTDQVYFIATCAGDAGMSEQYAEKQLAFKHFDVLGFRAIIMPSSFNSAGQTKALSDCQEILAQADQVIQETAELIRDGLKLPETEHRRSAMSIMINPLMYAFMMGTKKYHVSDTCTGCGMCVEACPLGSIRLSENHKPVWENRCTQCGACMGVCPQGAINYGSRTEGKPRYYLSAQKEK
jgi:ferredoxin/flavodoxin